MLLSGSDIQNHPLRDFVTPRNPKSHYGFVNYLKENNRIFEFLNLPLHYPLRSEYANYVRWVTKHFTKNIHLSSEVVLIKKIIENNKEYWELTTNSGSLYYTRALVLGTGRAPNIPDIYQKHIGDTVFHLNDYLSKISINENESTNIAVLGASQSAVEIMLDLINRYPEKKIINIQRGYGFRLKDTSPFSDHVYFPDFVTYYHSLPLIKRQNLDKQLRGTNYSSADSDVINALYIKQYEEKLENKNRIIIINNTKVEQIEKNASGKINLQLLEINTDKRSSIQVDKFILATGFKDIALGEKGEKYPAILNNIHTHFKKTEDGVLLVELNYEVKNLYSNKIKFYLNGLCESSHGLGDAGSFSLLSIRSEIIADAIHSHLTNLNN